MGPPEKASISEETFDEFLESLGILAECEEAALREIALALAELNPQPPQN